MFTVCAQLKILTTATFSTLLLNRQYSWVRWRALVSLMIGVLLFSEHTWNKKEEMVNGNPVLGTIAVLAEVTLSGFASIYFERVIKKDSGRMNIWERNFQLSISSCPIYVFFILFQENKFGTGWSGLAILLSVLGAAGGLLVALSLKYADSILKTLATTGAIVVSSLIDHYFLDGPLTAIMVLGGFIVVLSLCDYTFDPTPSNRTVFEKVDKYSQVPASKLEIEETNVPVECNENSERKTAQMITQDV